MDGALLRAALVLMALAWADRALSQSAPPATDTELSKESLNPVARQITLPLRYQSELENGVDDQAKQTFEIDDAIVPFQLNEDWALVTRTKLPLVVQPPKKDGEPWTTGLGNGDTTFFLSPMRGAGLYWGLGPVLDYPATNSALGAHRWGAGASVAFLKKDQSPWVLGAVINNIWSFGGGPSSERINQLLLNPIISYHFAQGWAVGSSPNITASWLATGEKWTVPVGGGLSKTFRTGKDAIKLSFDAYYNAVRAKSDKDTVVLQSTLTFLFPR